MWQLEKNDESGVADAEPQSILTHSSLNIRPHRQVAIQVYSKAVMGTNYFLKLNFNLN